jgi:hypothetical protein
MQNRLLLLGTAALKADLAGKVEDGAAPGNLRGEPDGVEAVAGQERTSKARFSEQPKRVSSFSVGERARQVPVDGPGRARGA